MRMVKTKSGYIAYECSVSELQNIGGLGICDFCNNFAVVGYLIPVLNSFYCRKCFERWDSKAKYYANDIIVERKNDAYYRTMIPITA